MSLIRRVAMRPRAGAVDSNAVIVALFAGGEQGGWYDPSDFSTMFQDTAATSPVTAVGQTVARINDKSGRGNHRSQDSAARRPVLQVDGTGRHYLDHDGVDDSLSSAASIDLTGSNSVSFWAGIRRQRSGSTEVLIETSASPAANDGAFGILCLSASRYTNRYRGTVAAQPISSGIGTPPVLHVLCATYDIGGPSTVLRVNQSEVINSTASAGTGNFGNHSAFFYARTGGSLPFEGREYATIIRAGSSDSATISSVEAWINGKTGAF